MTRAVITGFGAVSAFGVGARALLEGLAAGGCAVREIRSFDASAFPSRVAGEVPVASVTAAWLREHLAVAEDRIDGWAGDGYFRDRKVAFGLLAAAEAWRHAGCGRAEQDAALSIALGMEHTLFDDLAMLVRDGEIDWARDSGLALPHVHLRVPLDVTARIVGEALQVGGPATVHASACAGGALAVAHAAARVERGLADVVLCGAADSMLEPFGFGGIARLGAPSPRSEPDACRPFDRRRDGMVIGEGAAMFVVESEERALARGARPLARVLGWGSSQDAWRLSAPRADGAAAARAMQRAVGRAGCGVEAVGYINAHGTGTPLNDVAEARAIRTVFGDATDRIPVSSIKGAVGHLMAGSGAIELAACLLPLTRDLLPGTANHRERDPDCALDVIGEQPRAGRVDVVLSNSFGFGGQNASVVLGRWS